MARVTEVKEEVRTYRHLDLTYTCDKCGKEISPEPEDDDSYNQELLIYLNPEMCVRSSFRRDYCRECLLPIWDLICEAIGADPEDDSNSDFDDS